MRVVLMLAALLFASVLTGVAIGRYTVNGVALAAAPGPIMPRGAVADEDARPLAAPDKAAAISDEQ